MTSKPLWTSQLCLSGGRVSDLAFLLRAGRGCIWSLFACYLIVFACYSVVLWLLFACYLLIVCLLLLTYILLYHPTYKVCGGGRPFLNIKQAIVSWFDPQSVIKIHYKSIALVLVNAERKFIYIKSLNIHFEKAEYLIKLIVYYQHNKRLKYFWTDT